MKKKLLLVPLIVASVLALSVAVAVAVDHHYLEYKNKQTPPAPTITVADSNKRIENVKIQEEGEYNALVTRFNAQVLECQKGKAAYDKLAPALKVPKNAPLCGTAVVQP